MRVFLVLAAVAIVLTVSLLLWQSQVDSRSYEVYAVVAVYAAATGKGVVEIARWVLGVEEENYTVWQQLATMYTFYATT